MCKLRNIIWMIRWMELAYNAHIHIEICISFLYNHNYKIRITIMKIYFTTTTAEFDKYKDIYFKIRDFLVKQGHTLTRDWLGDTEKRVSLNIKEVQDIRKIYLDSVVAIRKADIIIAEDTVSNFSTGHLITLALQMRKPVLVMWSGEKHRKFNKMFIHGIKSDLLIIKDYTTENYTEIIDNFIKKFSMHENLNRFNLVINDFQRNYLDWAQYNTGLSRTQIIKNLINEKIDEDNEYMEYLKSATL